MHAPGFRSRACLSHTAERCLPLATSCAGLLQIVGQDRSFRPCWRLPPLDEAAGRLARKSGARLRCCLQAKEQQAAALEAHQKQAAELAQWQQHVQDVDAQLEAARDAGTSAQQAQQVRLCRSQHTVHLHGHAAWRQACSWARRGNAQRAGESKHSAAAELCCCFVEPHRRGS